jgi:aminopeptidase N
MGPERFDPAFREYIKAWAFKHPTPQDFFHMMRDQSGMDLDWFWDEWIFNVTRLDQSVDSVTTRDDGGSNVHLSSKATMIMPAELSLTFADGSHTTVKLPIEMWNLGPSFMYRVPEKKAVARVEVDPRHALPDINRLNNVWPRDSSPPVR